MDEATGHLKQLGRSQAEAASKVPGAAGLRPLDVSTDANDVIFADLVFGAANLPSSSASSSSTGSRGGGGAGTSISSGRDTDVRHFVALWQDEGGHSEIFAGGDAHTGGGRER